MLSQHLMALFRRKEGREKEMWERHTGKDGGKETKRELYGSIFASYVSDRIMGMSA